MKHLFILLFVLTLFGASAACPPGNLIISNNQDVTDFATNFPTCTTIAGDLIIVNSAVTDITGLSSITQVFGSVVINNAPGLTSLNGLENITLINQSLTIENNTGLVNLTGLTNLETIGGGFTILNNQNLTELNGLDDLLTVNVDLLIDNNQSLMNLSGLVNFTSAGQDIIIRNNQSLVNFVGLETVTSVGRNLVIDSNPFLENFTGLNNLESVGSSLNIVDNIKITSLSTLSALTAVGGAIVLQGNSDLSDCAISEVCDELDTPAGGITINTNAVGCNSNMEVETACNALPVRFSRFAAERAGEGRVALTWATAVEINNREFIIQRSSDGREFFDIGRREGSGTTNSERQYAFADRDAPTDRVTYYRIKQVDLDGQFSFSETASVDRVIAETATLSVFPNPAGVYTQVDCPAGGILRIIAADGTTVKTLNIGDDAAKVLRLDLSGYTKGLYTVSLTTPDRVETVRFVVR